MHLTHFFKAFLLESQCIIFRFSKHTTPLPTGEGPGVGLFGALWGFYFLQPYPNASACHNPQSRLAYAAQVVVSVACDVVGLDIKAV